MSWLITHKPAYDTDFIDLPKGLQKRATEAVAELGEDPTTPRGNTILPLKGWQNLWRYRLGDHRLIYSAVPQSQVVVLLAIGPRSSVYERFRYDPAQAEGPSITFGADLDKALSPQQNEAPEWTRHPEWFQTDPQERKARPLPRTLTPSLLRRWQIGETHHSELMRCHTEEDLLSSDVPDEVLGRVMDLLWPPDAQQIARQPDQMLFDPADLLRYAEGTLRSFLLALDEHQRQLVDWALAGPTLVKGGPGSGKSTVALYRLREIVRHTLEQRDEMPKILFTTFTNALTNVSESLLRQLLSDVGALDGGELPASLRVSTVDKTVMWIAHASGQKFEIAFEDDMADALQVARSRLRPQKVGELDRLQVSMAIQEFTDEYLLEEFDWVVEGQDCRRKRNYLEATRAGRGIPFHGSLRSAVWQLYQVYREVLAERGLRTWGQLRQLALDEVRSGNFDRRWDYVIVDEAQDLPPAALALCVELCRDPAGLFFTADANQSLYNRGFRWKDVHNQLQVQGRTRILRRNYRSTKEIVLAAGELLEDGASADALSQQTIHSGVPPVVYAAEGHEDQAAWLAKQIAQALKDLRLPVNAAAVLVPSNSLGAAFATLLEKKGMPARFMRSRNVQLEERCVKVLTLYAAKGLEFPVVAVAHVEADRLPKEIQMEDRKQLAEHLEAQRRLFYVGCTRAMRYLFVTHDRGLPSPFLADLSEDRWLHL